jgi:hypothetical protein
MNRYKRICERVRLFLTVGVCLLTTVSRSVTIITDDEFIPLHRASSYSTGSGLGTLDLVFFSGPTANNSIFDGANTSMPSGAKSGATLVDAYYITSFGDLRNFYTQQFIDNGSTINEMMIIVDLNESVAKDVNFDLLDITVGNIDIYGDKRDNPDSTDIDSFLQNITNTVTGGTIISRYATDASFTTSRLTIENGSGWADYGILTGIDPFDITYDNSDRIAFHLQFSSLTSGPEEVFLSGRYSSVDVFSERVPEPATILLLGCGAMAVLRRRRR